MILLIFNKKRLSKAIIFTAKQGLGKLPTVEHIPDVGDGCDDTEGGEKATLPARVRFATAVATLIMIRKRA